jgi:hypothetical protein
MIRAGLRRLLGILVVGLGGAAAISSALGALAGKSVQHSLAVGYYLLGALLLLGSLVLGSRGPMRAERDAESMRPGPLGILLPSASLGRRALRKATPEERRESRFTSLGLFVFGVLVILLGAVLDPARHAF